MLQFRSVLAIVGCALTVACSIPIVFNEKDDSWHHVIAGPRYARSLVAVIGEETLAKDYSFRVFISGARRWTPKTGRMLAQISDIEMPQMFETYRRVVSYEPGGGARPLVLVLDVADYRFADAQATLTLHVVAYDESGATLLDKQYTQAGSVEKGRMLNDWTIPSAVRQSSLEAFKATFRDMRLDLVEALDSEPPAGS